MKTPCQSYKPLLGYDFKMVRQLRIEPFFIQ
jgi:hypothetical protein